MRILERSRRPKYNRIRNPMQLDELCDRTVSELPNDFPQILKDESNKGKFPFVRRDMIFLVEVANTDAENRFCIELILGHYFNIRFDDGVLTKVFRFNQALTRRISFIVQCYAAEGSDLVTGVIRTALELGRERPGNDL